MHTKAPFINQEHSNIVKYYCNLKEPFSFSQHMLVIHVMAKLKMSMFLCNSVKVLVTSLLNQTKY